MTPMTAFLPLRAAPATITVSWRGTHSSARHSGSVVWPWALLSLAVIGGLADSTPASSADDKFYQVVDGKADARTYNGFRRYHAGCSHCHGPDGIGSTFAPSLVERLPDINVFRSIVLHGRKDAAFAMKGFAADPTSRPMSTTSMPIFRRAPT